MATTTNWWMFHGDTAHTGEVTDSPINSGTVGKLTLSSSVQVPGSILSTPAVADGYVYVGMANPVGAPQEKVPGGVGGSFLKIDITNGNIVNTFYWTITLGERDSHGFTGMGCTPAVVNGFVYFMGFNGVCYCLNASDLTQVWQTNLRSADLPQNQPVNNIANAGEDPPASGWSSPCVYGDYLWVGIGEGENPGLYSFVYCLDPATGKVKWIFCTNQYIAGVHNLPNVLPSSMVPSTLPPTSIFKVTDTVDQPPLTLGCSVWSSPAYDPDLDILYVTTGNPVPDGVLPSVGYSVGVLALKGTTGEFVGFVQFPPESSYRSSDVDVDIGGAVTLYEINGRKVAGVGCKNGSYMIVDAQTLEILTWRQMLPKNADGSLIPTVDPHGNDDFANNGAFIPNDQSDTIPTAPQPPDYSGENFHGTYSTAALCSSQQKLFIGLGGNNYHWIAPGIDYQNTPFMRAMDWTTLQDAWPTAGDPLKYTKASAAMYQNAGESGISVPAVVNDVVFMSTTQVALYAFSATDGTLLWNDMVNFGSQTEGFMGGYGYCMGPAIWSNYVVAGALVQGRTAGGVLNIYKLGS